MANAKRTVKPKRSKAQLVVCPECGHALDPRTASPAKRKSPRRILMDGILAALETGPATPAEIDDRMGFRSSERTAMLCRILERKNLIKKIATIGDRPGRINAPVGIYALVIASTDSAEPPSQAQAVEQISTGHNISPRGARS